MKGIKIFSKKTKTKRANMLVNSIEIFLKKRKTKIENIVVNIIKIFQKMKNKGWLSIGKIILKCRKIKTD